jgi:hypothetical protein
MTRQEMKKLLDELDPKHVESRDKKIVQEISDLDRRLGEMNNVKRRQYSMAGAIHSPNSPFPL